MLRSVKGLRDYHIQASDGNIGRVKDFLFDGECWLVRYAVVDTSEWLPGRKVLLIPGVLGTPSTEGEVPPVDLTRAQVRHSPDIDMDKPVSRQNELDLFEYYGWPVYWWQDEHNRTPMGGLWNEPEAVEEPLENPDEREFESPWLLFGNDLTGLCHVSAEGDDIGTLQDTILEEATWAVLYLVVIASTGSRRVLLATDYVQSIDLGTKDIYVSLPADAIAGGPLLADDEPVTPDLVKSLHAYYDRYVR